MIAALIEQIDSIPGLVPAYAAFLGLCIGSFINAFAYRLPRNISLFAPSMCPESGRRIAWRDNIPVISYVILRGRGRFSGKPIGIHYPIIEATCGIAFYAIAITFRHQLPLTAVCCTITAVLLALVETSRQAHKLALERATFRRGAVAPAYVSKFPER